jgi:cytoskeletal protein RodZ
MVIFPLSWYGKIVLILIAIMLGIILWKMMKAFPSEKQKRKMQEKQEKK